MGVIYLVFELNSEMVETMRRQGGSIPNPPPQSRLPLLSEVKAALGELDGYKVDCRERSGVRTKGVDFEIVDKAGYDAGWSASLWTAHADDRTRLPVDNDTVHLGFDGGSPELAVAVIEKLSHSCGPLVLMLTVDGRCLLVVPGTDPPSAVSAWLQ